ncbi:MAG: hypothetical protein ACPGYL_03155, partial [Rhodospirillaceae bacterium]
RNPLITSAHKTKAKETQLPVVKWALLASPWTKDACTKAQIKTGRAINTGMPNAINRMMKSPGFFNLRNSIGILLRLE